MEEMEPAQKKMRTVSPHRDDPSEQAEVPEVKNEEMINPATSEKRKDYMSWDDYFMSLAFLSAQRSKDPVTQVGAIIVNIMNRVVGLGYNGFPTGISDDEFPWGKTEVGNPFADKNFYVCHAELNAIMNKNSACIKGCRIYSTHFPCFSCTKYLIQSGIEEVVYAIDKNSEHSKIVASKRMLKAAGINYRQFKPTQEKVLIDFKSLLNL